MGFVDLDKPAGIKVLDEYLLDKSYIVGNTPTAADAAVYESVAKAPEDKYVNALRWYKHIASYGAEIAKFEGEKKAASFYGPEIKAAAVAEEDDDDIDLFGSDDEEEDAEAARIREERLAAYNAKKAAKPKAAAKSMIILDVKPWDDETDMDALKTSVRSIEIDGLVWGSDKLVAIGYGIKKLQITCVVEDDKVGVDDLVDQITAYEDYVQSVDIAAFNKL